MRKTFLHSSLLALLACVTAACGSNSGDDENSSGGAGGKTSTGGSTSSGGTASGGSVSTGGSAGSGGSSGSTSSGGTSSGGSGGTSGSGGSGGTELLPPACTNIDECPTGKWINVTSPEMDPGLFTGSGGFGVGNIVQDPKRPTDMYAGGYGSIWKSTDYGGTWTEVPSNPVPPYEALGHVLAIGGDGDVATLWMANVYGDQKVFRSTDAGLTFTLTGALTGGGDASLYSIVVDPNDSTHLISGFHEQDGVAESTDSGDTWDYVGTSGWPGGGVSWFPFFVDTGDAATTSQTWFAIAQGGGSAVMTTNGGDSWAIPNGISGLQHPHGNSNLYQDGNTLFISGGQGPGDGIYRSTDLGANWTRVSTYGIGLVWGSAQNMYGMWAWACASCGWDGNANASLVAPQPGTDWTAATTEAMNGLDWGPNSVAVTSDGTHTIFVGAMWASGLWRYIEP